MLEHRTASDIAAEIEMMRTAFAGTILMVEGDTDCRVFNKWIEPSHCQILPAYGKENAIEALQLLEEKSLRGILAIVDADFWHLDQMSLPSNNLILTDLHDLELMIIQSQALDRFLEEYGSARKIKQFLDNTITGDLRTELLYRSLPISLLRWLSIKEHLNLRFKRKRLQVKGKGKDKGKIKTEYRELDYDTFVHKESLTIDLSKLVLTILRFTEDISLHHYEKLLSKLSKLCEKPAYDQLQLTVGHDLTAILGIGLRKVLGNQSKEIADRNNIESILRLSYDYQDFKKTKLYQQTKQWEDNNQPFKVFI
jgi:hypothetical protein